MRSEASYESKAIGNFSRNQLFNGSNAVKPAWGEDKNGEKKKYKLRDDNLVKK